jgi:hypothetical protein
MLVLFIILSRYHGCDEKKLVWKEQEQPFHMKGELNAFTRQQRSTELNVVEINLGSNHKNL